MVKGLKLDDFNHPQGWGLNTYVEKMLETAPMLLNLHSFSFFVKRRLVFTFHKCVKVTIDPLYKQI